MSNTEKLIQEDFEETGDVYEKLVRCDTSRNEAIYNGFCEIIPFSKDEVEVQVEDGEDGYGVFVRVHHEGKISSKYYYETD
jgi:hypothetical protein